MNLNSDEKTAGILEIPKCTICLEDLRDNLCALQCGHVFHLSCITPCFKINGFCPVCKALTTKYQLKLYYIISKRPWKFGQYYQPGKSFAEEVPEIVTNMQNIIEDLKEELRIESTNSNQLKKTKADLEFKTNKYEAECNDQRIELQNQRLFNQNLKEQNCELQSLCKQQERQLSDLTLLSELWMQAKNNQLNPKKQSVSSLIELTKVLSQTNANQVKQFEEQKEQANNKIQSLQKQLQEEKYNNESVQKQYEKQKKQLINLNQKILNLKKNSNKNDEKYEFQKDSKMEFTNLTNGFEKTFDQDLIENSSFSCRSIQEQTKIVPLHENNFQKQINFILPPKKNPIAILGKRTQMFPTGRIEEILQQRRKKNENVADKKILEKQPKKRLKNCNQIEKSQSTIFDFFKH